MAKIDLPSLAWGLILGIAGTGIYDAIDSFLHNQFPEGAFHAIAAGVTMVILMVLLRKNLIPNENKRPSDKT